MNTSRESSGYQTIGSNDVQEFYNEAQDQVLFEIRGLKKSRFRSFLYHVFGILFLGFPYVIFNYYPKLKKVKFKPVTLQSATELLVSNKYGRNEFISIDNMKLTLPEIASDNFRYFLYQHNKYVWDCNKGAFVTLDALIPFQTADQYLNNLNGLSDEEYKFRLTLYGLNKIEVEVKSYWILFVQEVLNPFYAFQAFSVGLWLIDDYISYAVCVIILTLFSSITSLIQTRRQSEALHDLVESSKCHEVTVVRKDGETDAKRIIDPTELVPGDLISLPSANYIMPCDAILLTGQCIVNESVLTGESVPITKSALHAGPDAYDPDVHKRNTLFSGTHVIQTRYYGGEPVVARVVRTGFDTTKGSLVKSILYPAPVGLKFYKDSFKFIFVLFTVAGAGMVYCLYLYISRGARLEHVIVRTLDIITIVVPPALPAAMAVGTVYSQNRLKKIGIFCISPPRINVCGKIKIACFDKTGTLTHDGLEMSSVIPSESSRFCPEVADIAALDDDDKLVQAMATCHSLTRIDEEITGDPLDMKMFEFTRWELHEAGDNENERFDVLAPTYVSPKATSTDEDLIDIQLPYEIGIIRQFTFSSTLQCMSVIGRDLRKPNMTAFTKGAPERVMGMCSEHTVPPDFAVKLSQYTAQGYRVIALAYKELPVKMKWMEAQKVHRHVIECDLNFLGFLIMHNPLKIETAPVIKTLHSANIRTVMITGDNILTAISVAHDCGMVRKSDQIFILSMERDDGDCSPKIKFERAGGNLPDDSVTVNFGYDHHHFAIDGKTWNKLKCHYKDMIPSLLVKTTIFARFQPDQKTQLITSLQGLDYVVSMVGDGANDCGALKAAHVGVSLSQAEASVAAPFTSAIPNISCLVHLMLEGRCALVTSFAIFKYMALYSLIQFFTVLILYKEHSIMGDYQFLFIDMIITTSLAVTIGRQGPSNVLCPKRPMSSLVSAKNLIPLVLQITTCAFVQVGAIYYLFQQTWFKPIPSDATEPVIVSWENTTVFTISCYQYIILATMYSKGRPYRRMLITNFWFLAVATALTGFTTWLMVYPCRYVADLMNLVYVGHGWSAENRFKYSLLAFPVVHFLLALFIEMGISDRDWLKKFIQFLTCKSAPKNKYKLLLQQNSYRSLLSEDV
ncbi:unnamed protein product [Phyllotreta striolata]|uniref:Cation-transporting ATPase n=1 Tax=Phyllotreta striolata TaxID=444603 RepID=A0A9N9TXW9_PHYSR|nr:unnamed protein product [Phyllotreta striolata]